MPNHVPIIPGKGTTTMSTTMSTTVSTTGTLTTATPARPTAAALASTAVPAVTHPPAGLGYLATVSVRGRLLLPAAASDATAAALRRRTRTGTVYRMELGGGIICWLDGDQHDGGGQLNWVVTQMCTALSGGTFLGPEDAPFICGPALFTGTSAAGPVALSDEQLRRIVDAHADHIDIDTHNELDHLAQAAAVEPQLALT